MVSHASSGITNRYANDQMGALRTMDPSVYNAWTNDFYNYTAADWVVTESAAGTTQAIVDGAGGLLAITLVDAGATDYAQLQWAGGSGAGRLTHYWSASKDFLMKTRIKVSDATNTAIACGITSVDTSVIASAPADGIYFLKAEDSTTVTAQIVKSGVGTSSLSLGTMADDTFVELALVYTADDVTWRGYFNNTLAATLNSTTNSPVAGLCVTPLAILNSEAIANVVTTDYLNVYCQR
jgi:hypothetical protein